jgi:aldose 1-epimerase
MSFSVAVSGQQPYQQITLADNAGTAVASIYAFGAIVNHFSIEKEGERINVIDGFTSVADAMQNMTPAFKSSKLSPFVCRLQHGRYVHEGNNYTIEKFYLPPHAIHGLVYNAGFVVTDTFDGDDAAGVTLAYTYAGTDKGYPFSLSFSITWVLGNNNTLRVYTQVTNLHNSPVPYADGWHPYFTLGCPVDECILQFDSDTMLEFDDTLIPTGNTIQDTRFEQGVLMEGIQLDNCFVLKPHAQAGCTFSNQRICLAIQPLQQYGYLQVYTPNHRQSIAIENLSAAPDAFNNGMGLLQLQPGKTYSFATSYQLT